MRILVTGASGQLGAYLLRETASTGDDLTAWCGTHSTPLFGIPLQPVDLAKPDDVAAAFAATRPDCVIHAAALSRLSDCQRDPNQARRVNVEGTSVLADLCAGAGSRFVHVSTDMVFSGEQGWYRESDKPAPLSVYGRTKAEAEQAALAAPRSIVVRVSLLYGPTLNGRPAFFDDLLASLHEKRPITLFDDEWRTPLDKRTAARALLAIARSDITGILHVGGPERLSRLETGLRVASYLHLDPTPIVAASRDSAPAAEPRPRDLSLDSSRWRNLFPDLDWPIMETALAEPV
jgi:dTDP-4-dehydrorhamnose reductase